MADPVNILVLTADAGFGHRSAANAVAAAVQERYTGRVRVDVANPLDQPGVPPSLQRAQKDYDKIVTQWPEFWRLNYQLSDRQAPAAVLDQALTVMLFRFVRSVIKQYQPQVIVSTYPFFMAPLNAYLTLRKLDIPYLTVVTDLTNTHRMWFNPGANLVLMPTQEAFDQAVRQGRKAERMRLTGIPVNPAFVHEQRPALAIRQELGWDTSLPVVLVVGSKRVKNLMPMLRAIDAVERQFQLVLVAGGDDSLFAEFQEYAWRRPVQTYNFVRNMPQLMRAADLVVSKAGGLVVTESLACGLPMLLVDVTPGQEEGNAQYVIARGAAEWAQEPAGALEILSRWLAEDRKILAQRAQAAVATGLPQAAYTVADLAWQVVGQGRLLSPSRLRRWAGKFRQLLQTFDISEEG